MARTKNIIEIMRGIHRITSDYIIDIIVSHNKCECFFEDIFAMNGLLYNTETLKQKRVFVAAITEYFIIKNCKNIKLSPKDNKYYCGKSPVNKKSIINAMNKYFEIQKDCNSFNELLDNYAQLYNENVRDFSDEISINRDDMLSDFAKSIEQLYNYKEEK